jgi:8-oxo-dGTP diphosphatase
MAQPPDVVAAGVVVWRPGREVLLVHRPRYDDWSFPKGKLDPDEAAAVAAVREVAEETGLMVRLGRPLQGQRYPNGRSDKQVHYWVGWAVGSDRVEDYQVNDEIDDVRWVPLDKAERLLSYPRDRETLAEAVEVRKPTHALVVLRHAEAVKRKEWAGEDAQRPLTPAGQRQAASLAALLATYDAGRIVSSSSTRCLETVAPYAGHSGWPIEPEPGLSEEEATTESVREVVALLLEERESVVLCGHRPVLPEVFAALDLDPVSLDPGALVVVHHRKGRVRATELHQAP